MGTLQRTPFWLEVRKAYIIENFNNLVQYLKEYSKYPDKSEFLDDNTSDFGRTFHSLKELVDDYFSEKENDCIYSYEGIGWTDISLKIKVMCTYLLAARIKGITDYKILAKIVDVLLLLGCATTLDSIYKLRGLTIACMAELRLINYGFTWKTIVEWDSMSPEVICMTLGQTIFDFSKIPLRCHEGKGGIVLLKDGIVSTAPMNVKNYMSQTKKTTQFVGRFGTHVDVEKTDYKGSIPTFADLRNVCSDIFKLQSGVVATPTQKKKAYGIGDELIAKVIGYYEYGILVESVDQRYYLLSGKVYIGTNVHGLNYEDFKKYFQCESLVVVKVQDNSSYPFIIEFENFYEQYARSCDTNTYGIYSLEYRLGYQWLTIDGISVNVKGKDVAEYVVHAIENELPISLDLQESIYDKNGHLVTNAVYSSDEIDPTVETGDAFVKVAKKNLIEAFANYAFEQRPVSKQQIVYENIHPSYIKNLAHLEYFLAQKIGNTQERYIHLFISKFLAMLDDNKKDAAFISIEMNYQECLVEFAIGKSSPKLISFSPSDELQSISSVKWRMDVVSCLKNYEEVGKSSSMLEFHNLLPDEQITAIEGLIQSSNHLNGKISQPEINRIKKQITKHLSVEDEFVNTIEDITYYGEESDTLEFKSSAVFPPDYSGQAEPVKQLWTIMKTICGFLNSLSGGEILLGVNDNGNSCGLCDDVNYLYQNGKISEVSMDKYRNYIKLQADRIFKDDINMSEGKEITTGRINYLIERNKENHDILRIQVRPYEYGVVLFVNNIDRPNYIATGYIRTSGATISLTDELKRQIRETKLNASSDNNIRKNILLQQACRENKQVRLVRYLSQSGIKDRVVEPYKPLPEHDAFLCYDTSVSKKPIREFKISRIEEVVILDKSWANTSKHKNLNIDIFGMLEDSTDKPYKVILKLAPLAYNLLKEEYKSSERSIKENTEHDCNEYPWMLETTVSKSSGIGRFYIGLANEIKIVEGEPLRQYVKEFVAKNLSEN